MHFPDRVEGVASSEPLHSAGVPAGAGGRGAEILLVDDEPTLRGLTQRVLARAGFRVSAAADADEALALLERKACEPQLLITDLELPRVSGWDLAHDLRTRRPGLAVLYVTGRGDEARLRERVECEGQMLLSKPYTTQSLLEHVQRALARA